jgi:MFS family permease
MGVSVFTQVIPMTVVANWFRKKVSTATGIVVSGTACSGLLIPLVTRTIDTYGWRTAMVIFGVGVIVIYVPLVFVVRHKPEQYGYLPDGALSEDEVSQVPDKDISSEQNTELYVETKQAIKSRVFWHISIAVACHILVTSAVVTHVMPYLGTIGITRSFASLVASAIPLLTILGRLSFGWFGDKFNKRWVMATGYIFLLLSMVFFSLVPNTGNWLLVLFIILLGLGYGGPIPVIPAILREYFRQTKLGTILGFTMGVATVGSLTGPILAGWIFDTFHSYYGAWFACAAISLIGMICLLTVPSADNYLRKTGKR